jgi:hypothetical protein
MSDFREPAAPIASETQRTLILSGDGVAFLTAEHTALLAKIATAFAGGKAVELSVDIDATVAARHLDVQPIWAGRDEFRSSATRHGHTAARGYQAYAMLRRTNSQYYRDRDPQPDIVERDEFFDLNTVYSRLRRTFMNPRAWIMPTEKSLRFLAHLVNDVVKPDELLDVNGDLKERPYLWKRTNDLITQED